MSGFAKKTAAIGTICAALWGGVVSSAFAQKAKPTRAETIAIATDHDGNKKYYAKCKSFGPYKEFKVKGLFATQKKIEKASLEACDGNAPDFLSNVESLTMTFYPATNPAGQNTIALSSRAICTDKSNPNWNLKHGEPVPSGGMADYVTRVGDRLGSILENDTSMRIGGKGCAPQHIPRVPKREL